MDIGKSMLTQVTTKLPLIFQSMERCIYLSPKKPPKWTQAFWRCCDFHRAEGPPSPKGVHTQCISRIKKHCLGHFCWHMGHRHPYHSGSHAWIVHDLFLISHIIPYDLMRLHFISYVIIQRISLLLHMIVKWYPSPWPPLRDAQHFSPPSGEPGPSWLQSEGCSLAGNWDLSNELE